MDGEADRVLRNLVWGGDPITRLKAVRELRREVDRWFDSAELELVRVARGRRAPGGALFPFRWKEIAEALGIQSGQHASRLFKGRLRRSFWTPAPVPKNALPVQVTVRFAPEGYPQDDRPRSKLVMLFERVAASWQAVGAASKPGSPAQPRDSVERSSGGLASSC
jgi:hypothetical protein